MLAAIAGAVVEKMIKVDNEMLSDDDKDVAKQAIAAFVASFPIGSEPPPEDIAERGRMAVRAWRKIGERT